MTCFRGAAGVAPSSYPGLSAADAFHVQTPGLVGMVLESILTVEQKYEPKRWATMAMPGTFIRTIRSSPGSVHLGDAVGLCGSTTELGACAGEA